MHFSINNLIEIQKQIQLKISKKKILTIPTIIAVCKTFPLSDIIPLINHGHLHFGENKINESLEKWQDVKFDFENINLHMIGKLQTNKVKHAVSLFDYIHSLDNFKLAEKISNEQIKQNKKLKIFIQVNIGNEEQKSGISFSDTENFYKKCTKDLGLNIIGFMCIPPNDKSVFSYFSQMKDLTLKTNLKDLSMGMSNDYLDAIDYDSTYLRIGSKIFGNRN